MGKCPNYLNGMDVILMVVDRFSKLAKMAQTKTIATTFDSAKLFFDTWANLLLVINMPSLQWPFGNICFGRWEQNCHSI